MFQVASHIFNPNISIKYSHIFHSEPTETIWCCNPENWEVNE